MPLKTIRDGSADAIRRFKLEFRALADLNHRNLVQLGELFCDRDDWFFTMELLCGVDFINYVTRLEDGPTPFTAATPATSTAARVLPALTGPGDSSHRRW